MKTQEKPPKHDEGSDRHVALVPWSPRGLSIPLAFKPLEKGGIGDRHVGLLQNYLVDPEIPGRSGKPRRQSKWKQRAALVPELDLGAFNCNAVIDWIELRVETSSRIWAGNVSRQLGAAIGEKLWAELADDEKGGYGKRFDLKMQDPTPDRLYRLLDAIDAVPSLSTDQQIPAIEISVDFYPHSRSEIDRLLMTDLLWRHLLPPEEVWKMDKGWPRCLIGGGRGTNAGRKNTIPLVAKPKATMETEPRLYAGLSLPADAETTRNLIPEFHLQPAVDGTVCFGPEMGDSLIRVMHKTINQQDRRTGTQVKLGEEECRARVEVTLRGSGLHKLGLGHVWDLPMVKFGDMATEYFRFCLPTVSHHAGSISEAKELARALGGRRELEVFWRSGVFGLDLYQCALRDQKKEARSELRHRGASGRERDRAGFGKAGFNATFYGLGDRVYDALRRLSWEL